MDRGKYIRKGLASSFILLLKLSVMMQNLLYRPCRKGKAVINLISTLKSSSSKTSYTTLMLCNSLISYPLLSSLPSSIFKGAEHTNASIEAMDSFHSPSSVNTLHSTVTSQYSFFYQGKDLIKFNRLEAILRSFFRKKFDSVYLLAELT